MCGQLEGQTAELSVLKKQIDKHVSKDWELIVDMLKALSLLVMTTELPSATKIGVSVNAAKKAFIGTAVEALLRSSYPNGRLLWLTRSKRTPESVDAPKRQDYNEEKVESAGASSSQAVSSSDDPARMMKLKTKITKKIGEGPLPTRNEQENTAFPTIPTSARTSALRRCYRWVLLRHILSSYQERVQLTNLRQGGLGGTSCRLAERTEH